METDGKGKVSVYPATEKDDGTYEKNGEELPAGSVQKDGAVYELVSIKNVPIQYRPAVWAITGIIQERVLC